MAQEKDRKKPKRTPRSKGTATEEKPYVEQFSELLMVHNKNDPKAGLGVVSQVDEKGNYRTVPPDRKHENSFLKFDRNSSILENFIRNFWRQFKEPTHFRLLRMTYNDYKRNRQALDDLAKGKQTDAVKEFLKHYEIRPRKHEFVKNYQKTHADFINIYRKDKSLLLNYMKLYYNNSCENVTANITENIQRCLQRQF